MQRRGGRCWNHNISVSHYNLIIFQKIDSWWQKCVWNAPEIMNNQQPITVIAPFLVALWPQNTHNNILQRLKLVCYAAECRWVYGMFWDDKSLCNQAVAQMHIWWILSFWASADKTEPALQHTSDRAGVFCACSQGKGIENLLWLLYMNGSCIATVLLVTAAR